MSEREWARLRLTYESEEISFFTQDNSRFKLNGSRIVTVSDSAPVNIPNLTLSLNNSATAGAPATLRGVSNATPTTIGKIQLIPGTEVVRLLIPKFTVTVTGSGATIITLSSIPTAYRPLRDTDVGVLTMTTPAGNNIAQVNVSASGLITFNFPPFGADTFGAGVCGALNDMVITWSITPDLI